MTTINDTGITLGTTYKVPFGFELPYAGRYLTATGSTAASVKFTTSTGKVVWLTNPAAELLAMHAGKATAPATKSRAFDAVEFAKRSAAEALDQRDAYMDSAGIHRGKLIEALAKSIRSESDYSRALNAYDAEAARLFELDNARRVVTFARSASGVPTLEVRVHRDTLAIESAVTLDRATAGMLQYAAQNGVRAFSVGDHSFTLVR